MKYFYSKSKDGNKMKTRLQTKAKMKAYSLKLYFCCSISFYQENNYYEISLIIIIFVFILKIIFMYLILKLLIKKL